MKQATLSLIRFYQKTVSPDHGVLGRAILGRTCRFEPTCSQYTYQAVQKYGIWRGLGLGLRRISRCHPWANGGADPIPPLEPPVVSGAKYRTVSGGVAVSAGLKVTRSEVERVEP